MKILILDDNPVLPMIVADHLREQGHQVIVANDATQGLAHLRQEPIDLLVVDLVMPDLDGLEFIRKAKDYKPNIAVVLMTGFAELLEEKGPLVEELGAETILHKPFSFPEIDALIKSMAKSSPHPASDSPPGARLDWR